MRRIILGLGCALALTGCGSTDDSQPDASGSTDTSTVVAKASVAGTTTSAGRQAGSKPEVDLYVRELKRVYTSNGQAAPSEAEAISFAESICDFLDTGASPYDAVQVMVDTGYSEKDASKVIPKAIGAVCGDHFPR